MSATTTTIPSPDPSSAKWNIYVDSQTFNLTGLDGNPTPLSLKDVNDNTYFLLSQVGMWGFTIGLTGATIVVLCILTNREKARRPIFILNLLSLILMCLLGIIKLGLLCSQFAYGIGENWFGALAQYTPNIYIVPNVFACVMRIILFATIMSSLILQVRVVFTAEPQTRKIITILLILLALTIEGFWAAFQIIEIKIFFDFQNFISPAPYIYKTAEYSLDAFITICTGLFIYKLFITIQRRRRMGFQGFGPLQILFIMFGQCLIIPLTCILVNSFISGFRFQGLDYLGYTFLTVLLPLSAVWASHDSDGITQKVPHSTTSSSFRNLSRIRKFFKGASDSRSENSELEKGSEFSEIKGKKSSSAYESQNLHSIQSISDRID